MSKKFTVAICGGGVGGLVCAIVLSQYSDIQVDIYEAANQFSEIGAGIGMWPRTWKIMQALGLDHDLAEVAIVPPNGVPQVAFTFRKGDQAEGRNFYALNTPGGLISIHRAHFQSTLLRHLPSSCNAHTRKRLVSYTQPARRTRRSMAGAAALPKVTLYFQDGTTAFCDVLLGADGVKSNVRTSMMKEMASLARAQGDAAQAEVFMRAAPARWSGTSAYRAVIPAEKLRSLVPGHRVLTHPMIYFGKDTQITVYPIAHGTLINFAAFRARYDLENTTLDAPWVQDVPRDELLRDFHEWEPEVQALLQCVQTPSRWAVHTSAPLGAFTFGRVALVGDAAHAMMPYQGSGAGQAVEDAYVLATLLGHPSTSIATLPRALQIYDAVRRPFAQHVAKVSRDNGLLFTMNYPGLTLESPGEDVPRKLAELSSRIKKKWEWAWESSVDDDVERAVRMLEEAASRS
ncbi:FAD/NAD(P)-binding domain-containing protein [Obba rivulosa]|uniref:FAD/NAD(P)-binding domain-containing protein n=1 Tax=Obba rivulosa TaxID=1052685 RepID=A0A8E2DUW3_9APHY|nr:FAD/NAD(P)-binding domain-containing protein [Obba rivulosa]